MHNLKKNKKVIAGVIIRNNKILIAQRAKKDALFGKWEFPGGKMEDGESEKECLTRELFEEFSIKAEVGDYLCSSFFEHNGVQMEMRVFYIYSFSGDLVLHEHQQIKWVTKEELLSYDVPEPDKPIIQKLLNPSL